VLRVIGVVDSEHARYCFESVNERISDSSECSDASELLFEGAPSTALIREVWTVWQKTSWANFLEGDDRQLGNMLGQYRHRKLDGWAWATFFRQSSDKQLSENV